LSFGSTRNKAKRQIPNVGKRVLVVGACTSGICLLALLRVLPKLKTDEYNLTGHDVTHDVYQQGVETTMLQRKSTCVMSVKNVIPVAMGGPSVFHFL
jgi:trans-2-enoyl-CoA reductase